MFSGLALMILALPLNAVIAGFTRRFQLEQMKNKDERVKLMNEILGGVKVRKERRDGLGEKKNNSAF